MISITNFPKCKKCDADLVPLYKKDLDEESKAQVESLWWKCPECEKVVD